MGCLFGDVRNETVGGRREYGRISYWPVDTRLSFLLSYETDTRMWRVKFMYIFLLFATICIS